MAATAEQLQAKQKQADEKTAKKARSGTSKQGNAKVESKTNSHKSKSASKDKRGSAKVAPAAKVAAPVKKKKKSVDPLHQKHRRSPMAVIISLIILSTIYYGWVVSEDSYITPEEGIGYWLGIIGAMAMLLLLLYPLRKKWRPMRRMGPVKYWFKTHMFLGLLGPILILFHANFSLGSTNSTVAFFSMILVASSGVVGKYFYLKIHYGLYGKHANMSDLSDDLQLSKGMLGKYISISDEMKNRLTKYEKSATAKHGFIISLFRIPVTIINSRWLYHNMMHEVKLGIKRHASEKGWDKKLRTKLYVRSKHEFKNYIFHVRKVAEFTIYEQLFSLWHILHFPLFVALVFSAIAHVFAVHIF